MGTPIKTLPKPAPGWKRARNHRWGLRRASFAEKTGFGSHPVGRAPRSAPPRAAGKSRLGSARVLETKPEIPPRCFKFFQLLICLLGFCGVLLFLPLWVVLILFFFFSFLSFLRQECERREEGHVGTVTKRGDSSSAVTSLSQNHFPPNSCSLHNPRQEESRTGSGSSWLPTPLSPLGQGKEGDDFVVVFLTGQPP